LPRIAQREKIDKFGDMKYRYMENDGLDTYAYVVDTGIYIDHTYFEGRASYGYLAKSLEYEGHKDQNGHGTHCAGSIMSSIFGVAKQAEAISVKVLNFMGTGSVANIVGGLEWVFDDFTSYNGSLMAVASMSLGGSNLPTVDAAVQELIDAGLPVVVAAGNENSDACNVSPAKVPDAITVGASDKSDIFASYSNWGKCVDIIAPGTDIESTGHTSPTSTRALSGTSMATPHVAGAILRHMSQLDRIPSPAEVKEWVVSSASIHHINMNGIHEETPNKLLYAPCNVSTTSIDDNKPPYVSTVSTTPSKMNVIYGTWSLALFNMIVALTVCYT